MEISRLKISNLLYKTSLDNDFQILVAALPDQGGDHVILKGERQGLSRVKGGLKLSDVGGDLHLCGSARLRALQSVAKLCEWKGKSS